MLKIDEVDAKLLDAVQAEFPLVSQPFAKLGERLGVSSDEVLQRLNRLKEDGIVRQTSAILNASALGYRSALVAFAVEERHLDAVADQVASRSYVGHCYSRDSCYNLWFTVTLPDTEDSEGEVAKLADIEGVNASLFLPAEKVYKIGVKLPLAQGEDRRSKISQPQSKIPVELVDDEKTAVRVLQHDLPLEERPFARLAEDVGLSEDRLLECAKSLLDKGVMRRYAAVLRHREVGFSVNAMICWNATEDTVDRIGSQLATHPRVSHCYRRKTYPEWPYSLYTMIHCRSEEELEQTIAELQELAGDIEYVVLKSLREYKKARVNYQL